MRLHHICLIMSIIQQTKFIKYTKYQFILNWYFFIHHDIPKVCYKQNISVLVHYNLNVNIASLFTNLSTHCTHTQLSNYKVNLFPTFHKKTIFISSHPNEFLPTFPAKTFYHPINHHYSWHTKVKLLIQMSFSKISEQFSEQFSEQLDLLCLPVNKISHHKCSINFGAEQ